MRVLRISQRQARIFLTASLPVTCAAIGVAFAAVRYTSYYGILGALVAGLSVGAGILFSDGILYITDKGQHMKLAGLGLLMAVSAAIVIVIFPTSQHKVNGRYYLNLIGQICVIPVVFSTVALLHTAFLNLLERRRPRTA